MPRAKLGTKRKLSERTPRNLVVENRKFNISEQTLRSTVKKPKPKLLENLIYNDSTDSKTRDSESSSTLRRTIQKLRRDLDGLEHRVKELEQDKPEQTHGLEARCKTIAGTLTNLARKVKELRSDHGHLKRTVEIQKQANLVEKCVKSMNDVKSQIELDRVKFEENLSIELKELKTKNRELEQLCTKLSRELNKKNKKAPETEKLLKRLEGKVESLTKEQQQQSVKLEITATYLNSLMQNISHYFLNPPARATQPQNNGFLGELFEAAEALQELQDGATTTGSSAD